MFPTYVFLNHRLILCLKTDAQALFWNPFQLMFHVEDVEIKSAALYFYCRIDNCKLNKGILFCLLFKLAGLLKVATFLA